MYNDIINLPHYVSKKRPQMSMEDRAAQFAPFAALVGFDDGIEETNRQVEQFTDLDEDVMQELDEKIRYLQAHIAENPLVEITYFVPDGLKEGGEYKTVRGKVKKIDKDNLSICFTDKQSFLIKTIRQIILP